MGEETIGKDLNLELVKLEALSESAPQQLLSDINCVRKLKQEGAELPTELTALAGFVQSAEVLQKRGFYEFMLLDEYSLSYATPIKFAKYRAQRISSLFHGESVMDISCGVGAQLLELCKEVSCIGIEKDTTRYLLAKINVNLAFYNKRIPIKPEILNEDALSDKCVDVASKHGVIFCDSFREGIEYSPELNDLHKLYSGHYLVYEFKPRENIKEIMQKYPFLCGHAEIEYYGEEERCGRLTAYIGRGNTIKFYQADDYLPINLSYPHERLESVIVQNKQKVVSGFPSHDFFILNRCLVDNYFLPLLNFNVFALDKRRYVVEMNKVEHNNKIQLKPKRVFSPIESSKNIGEISEFLGNYEEYNVTLRFEIDPKEYWNFINENKLSTNRESKNRFSLFKFNGTFHLCEER